MNSFIAEPDATKSSSVIAIWPAISTLWLPDVADAALSPFDGPRALAFANLLLADFGVWMGARRATFLWAALPVVAVAGVEKIALHTSHFAALVGLRLIGDAPAFASTADDGFPSGPMTHITAGRFLSSPGL